MDLLEKASIILTPTAYNNGEALCVKPSDGSGDFDFSRNSAATRVNAQGLVENVQILSSNLVQNGDFSEIGAEEVSNGSFSQQGSEQITNGDFSNGINNWSTGSNNPATVSNEVLTLPVSAYIFQSLPSMGGKQGKIVVNGSGKVKYRLDIGSYSALTEMPFTIYEEFPTSITRLQFQNTSGEDVTIDNVSVVEVGQDWTFGTGWSVSEDKAVKSVSATDTNLSQSSVFTVGKTYKIVFNIESISGVIWVSGISDFIQHTTTGIKTIISTSTSPNITFRSSGASNVTITNISVKEVGQDWDLNDWSIGDSLASSGNTSSLLRQDNIFTSTTSIYKTTFKAKSVNGSSVTLRVYDGSGNNFETITITSSDFQDFELTRQRQGASASLFFFNNSNAEIEVTNISVIEITNETNLPRISYENFSYQDALGSELVVNGDFEDGSTGWSVAGGNPLFSNSSVNFVDFSTINSNNLVVQTGKTYKITYTISNKVGNSVFGFFLGGWNTAQHQEIGTHSEIIDVSSSSVIYIRNGNSNSSVTIDNVSVKEYLGQEVVPDSGCGSWLFEPQSTNLITYSEDFSQSYWNKSDTTVESGYLSPDGTNNAYKVTHSAQYSVLRRLSTIPAGDATLSVWIKRIDGNTDYNFFGGGTSKTITITNEWKRYNSSLVSDGTDFAFFGIQDFNASGFGSYLIWGAQVEQQSYATSYIPTSGTSVTRNQDVCNNGGSLASINSTEGVLYAEILKKQDDNDNFIIISLNNNASNNDANYVSVGFNNSNKFWFGVKSPNGSHINQTIVANENQFYKVALKYKSGDIAIWVNGVEAATSAISFSFTQTLDNLSFDYDSNGGFPFYGKTKALAVFPYLSDEELTELTTI